jgi:hypothetical protein
MSEVTELLAAYRQGQLTLEELAQRFQERSWPPRRASPRTAREAWQRELEDPEPIQDNSFDEVASAYSLGEITGEEYDRLAQAALHASRSGSGE